MSRITSLFSEFADRLPTQRQLKRGLPGYIASTLMIVVTALWSFWSIIEMYWEGWWGPVGIRLLYLVPGTACLFLTLLALTWPGFGGWLIIVLGGLFTLWWSELELRRLIVLFPVSGILVVIGGLFLLEARHRRMRRAEGWSPPRHWLLRNARYVFAAGIPLLILIGGSIYWLPIVLTRVDDGDRGARLIEGNGLTLTWAPSGPGWNWKQPWGGYPSWGHLALYGVPPHGFDDKPDHEVADATTADMATTGLCRYLSENGTTLMSEPQDIWRMPTADEIVRSLTRGARNAGCALKQSAPEAPRGRAECERTPDKETPLWAPDQAPIYYWAGDEYDAQEAYYVAYNGTFNSQPKTFGNPRHSHRCVKEP